MMRALSRHRAFYFGLLGLGLPCLILSLALGLSALAGAQPPHANPPHVNLIELDNQIISPVTAQYIDRAIARSESDHAVCLIIKLDTPGGLLESTRTIVKRIMNAGVPVVVYIAPSGSRAGSAGVFITLAAHMAAMAPSTNIGAAHPVTVGGDGGEDLFKKISKQAEQGKGEAGKTTGTSGTAGKGSEAEESVDPMADKILNDTVAWVTAIARTRGRNVEWAKRAVTESVSVGETEAVKENIVNFVAADVPDLLTKLNFRTVQIQGKPVVLTTANAKVIEIPMTLRQKVLATVVHPNVAYILMMLGILGLIFEFTHPGVVFPGVAGLICLALALYAFQVLPVNYAAVGLIVFGLILLVAEIKVTSYGLLAIGGIVSLTLGSLMLFDSSETSIRISLGVVGSMVITLAAITLFLVQRVIHSRTYPVATGRQGMIGLEGEALTDLNPGGMVFVHGETWSADSPVPVLKGQKVRVTQLDGLRLTVEPEAEKKDETHEKGEG